MLDDDTLPGLDPFGTMSQWYLCRWTRYGCRYGIRYWPGQHDWARSLITDHHARCLYRFGPDS